MDKILGLFVCHIYLYFHFYMYSEVIHEVGDMWWRFPSIC